jgi:hypothetical protein
MLERDILPIRIGVDSTVAPYRWSDLKSLSGMSSETAHGLASSGKRMGPIRAGGAERSRLSAQKSGGPSSITTVWSGRLSNGRAPRVGRRVRGPMSPRPCCLSTPMNQWGVSVRCLSPAKIGALASVPGALRFDRLNEAAGTADPTRAHPPQTPAAPFKQLYPNCPARRCWRRTALRVGSR